MHFLDILDFCDIIGSVTYRFHSRRNGSIPTRASKIFNNIAHQQKKSPHQTVGTSCTTVYFHSLDSGLFSFEFADLSSRIERF